MALIPGQSGLTCFPATPQLLLVDFAAQLTNPASESAVYSGTSAPTNTEAVWYDSTDVNNPVRKKYIKGAWRRDWNLPLGWIQMFNIATGGLVDGTGKGITGLTFEGWSVCNGNNGTVNMYSVDPYSWQGRIPMAAGGSVPLGGAGGAYVHVLNTGEMNHLHAVSGGNLSPSGSGQYINNAGNTEYVSGVSAVAHNNLPPYMGLNFCQYIGYASY